MRVKPEVCLETLRERRRALAWWALGVAGVVALNVAFYPSVRDVPGLADFSQQLPEAARALFAGGELDMTSPAGYLTSQVFALTAPLLFLVFAIGSGADAVAGEEERGTLDVILAQPISRSSYVIQRFLALVASVVLLGFALFVATLLGAAAVDLEIGAVEVAAGSGSVVLLAVALGGVALAAGAVVPGRGRAIAIATTIAIAAWLLDGLGQAVDALEPWRPLSPYYQTLGRNPLRTGVPWLGWGITAGVVLAVVAVAVVGFERRDVRR